MVPDEVTAVAPLPLAALSPPLLQAISDGTMMMRLFTRPFQPEDETEEDAL